MSGVVYYLSHVTISTSEIADALAKAVEGRGGRVLVQGVIRVEGDEHGLARYVIDGWQIQTPDGSGIPFVMACMQEVIDAHRGKGVVDGTWQTDRDRLNWLDANHDEMPRIYGSLVRNDYPNLRAAIDAAMGD